jgi:cyclopropane fatty-acyl-phospholipid synthase-like methyltransferase
VNRPPGVDFESRYRAEPDPWGYATSEYEHRKYAATLVACGPGPFSRALELGGSIGVFSALLAPRSRRLDTLDAAPTAVAAARGRLGAHSGAHARVGLIPDDLPPGPYDLVVASEILYYLDRERLGRTLARLTAALATGGRLVAVHWRPTGAERPSSADAIHRRLRSQCGLRSVCGVGSRDYLLDVLQRH